MSKFVDFILMVAFFVIIFYAIVQNLPAMSAVIKFIFK
jgi:hypothetical protein